MGTGGGACGAAGTGMGWYAIGAEVCTGVELPLGRAAILVVRLEGAVDAGLLGIVADQALGSRYEADS